METFLAQALNVVNYLSILSPVSSLNTDINSKLTKNDKKLDNFSFAIGILKI